MSQSTRCDICGKTADGTQPPPTWGYFFQPAGMFPTAQKAEYLARQRKDLCEGCTSALGLLIEELRKRLTSQAVEPDRSGAVRGMLKGRE